MSDNSQALALKNTLLQQRNWQDKYRALLLAARQSPQLNAHERTTERQVSGCEAQVWLHAELHNSKVHFYFYSDARLVHALIHVALLPVQQQSPQYVAQFDTEQWLQECGLSGQLSPSRSNGLRNVVAQAKQWASDAAADDAAT